MWLLRQRQVRRQSRFEALREFCRRYFSEHSREERGLYLLRGWLSSRQREEFDSKGYFEVIGCDTGRRYRVLYGTVMNVHELDEAGGLKMGWCFIPNGALVAGDVMLAQKIALETFERDALSVAKRFVPKESFDLTVTRNFRPCT